MSTVICLTKYHGIRKPNLKDPFLLSVLSMSFLSLDFRSTEKTRTCVQISDTCLTSQPGVAHNISSPSQDTTSPVRRIRSPTHLRYGLIKITLWGNLVFIILVYFGYLKPSQIRR